MATLYVENVPEELYSALRARARKNHKSMAAEVVSLLEQAVPTAKDLKRREQVFQQVLRLRRQRSPSPGPFPSTEQLLREDRER